MFLKVDLAFLEHTDIQGNFLKHSRLHKPMVLVVKQIYDLTADPAGVPHAQPAGFQTGSTADVQNTVYRKSTSILPYDGYGADGSIDIKFRFDFQLDLHVAHLNFMYNCCFRM